MLVKYISSKGDGSGLDADKVDGFDASQTPTANTIPVSDENASLRKFTPYFTGFKNRIINGDFSVWQRGTSAVYTSSTSSADYGYKTADRIKCDNVSAGGQFTVSKSEINGRSSFKVTVDTPPDNLSWDGSTPRYWRPFFYSFEGQHLYDLVKGGKDITISFLFKSNVSGMFSISLRNNSYLGQNNISDDTQFDTYVTTFNYDGSGIAKKITVTIPLNYSWIYGVFNDEKLGFVLSIAMLGDAFTTSILNQWQSGVSGNASGAPYSPLVATGCTNWASTAGNYVEIAELQLEEGDVATDFEYVPYDVQLMRCMRYYETIQDTTASQKWFWIPSTDYGARFYIWQFKVQKRTIPSITKTTYTTGSIVGFCIRPFIDYVEIGVDLGSTTTEIKLLTATADAEL